MHSDTVTYICTDNETFEHTHSYTSTTDYKTKQQCINMQLLLQNTQIYIYKKIKKHTHTHSMHT